MARFPALYVSHGSPNLAITPQTAAYRFLAGLGAQLPRPRAILIVSAHYTTRVPTVATAAGYRHHEIGASRGEGGDGLDRHVETLPRNQSADAEDDRGIEW